ncbi:O-antigen ligase family protein [Nitrospira sp. Nam74]
MFNLYQRLLAVLAIALFFSNASHFLFYKGWDVLGPPKIWVIGFVVLTVPLFHHILSWDLRRSPILLWCVCYVAVSLVWFFTASDSEMAWQELRLRAQSVLLLISLLLVFSDAGAILWARRTIALLVVVGVFLNVFEVFVPTVLNYSIGRSAGLYINPNSAALALVVGMALSLTALRPSYRGPFVVLVLLGVLTTISRQGTLALCVTVGLGLFWKAIDVRQIAVACALALLLVLGVLLPRLDALISYLESVGLSRFVEERVGWVMDPTLEESPYEDNTHSRMDAAAEAWDKFSQTPFWGQGVGTHLAMAGGNEENIVAVGSHNMYLTYMVDHGILGVLVFPLSVLAAVWRARGNVKGTSTAFAASLLILGFFSHNILMDTVALPLFALMASMTALSRDSSGEQGKSVTSEVNDSAWTTQMNVTMITRPSSFTSTS